MKQYILYVWHFYSAINHSNNIFCTLVLRTVYLIGPKLYLNSVSKPPTLSLHLLLSFLLLPTPLGSFSILSHVEERGRNMVYIFNYSSSFSTRYCTVHTVLLQYYSAPLFLFFYSDAPPTPPLPPLLAKYVIEIHKTSSYIVKLSLNHCIIFCLLLHFKISICYMFLRHVCLLVLVYM